MRLFAAVRLSDEMKTALIGMMHDLKKAGVRGAYVPAENLHVTLAFIGEADPAAVISALEKVRFRPFRLSLSGTGVFGDLLWAGLRGNQGLSAAAAEVRGALAAAGIGFDRKKFLPHITLVRRMSGGRKEVPVRKAEMTVKKISLMRSEVKEGKRVYTGVYACE